MKPLADNPMPRTAPPNVMAVRDRTTTPSMHRKAKIRIESDGTPFGTKVLVVLPEGQESVLNNVSCVEWRLDTKDGQSVVGLTVIGVGVDVIGYASRSTQNSMARAIRHSPLRHLIPGGVGQTSESAPLTPPVNDSPPRSQLSCHAALLGL